MMGMTAIASGASFFFQAEDGIRDSSVTGVQTCFFSKAEDGIRDSSVTGVQTCALPISSKEQLLRQLLVSARWHQSCSWRRSCSFEALERSQSLSSSLRIAMTVSRAREFLRASVSLDRKSVV